MGLLDDKKRENIASYIISMWHIEDMMRANDFDMDKLEEVLIAPMDADEKTEAEVRGWYAGVVTRMKEQGLQVRGHLSEVEEVLTELEFLHTTLTDVLNDSEYDTLFAAAQPGIAALQGQADENCRWPHYHLFHRDLWGNGAAGARAGREQEHRRGGTAHAQALGTA